MSPVPTAPPAFDLKSTAWTLTALRLHTADVGVLSAALQMRFGDTPDLFDDDPVVIDLTPLRAAEVAIDFPGLVAALRHHRLAAIAVQGGGTAQVQAARDAGLVEAMEPPSGGAPVPASASVAAPPPVAAKVLEPAVARPATSEPSQTVIVDKPLRSGQRVYARGADLVVLSVVNVGAEVIADGSIHVYGPLRGRAIAGARGDTRARIYSTCMEPQLVSIAGIYRTTETPLQAGVVGRAAQVRLDGESITFEPLTD